MMKIISIAACLLAAAGCASQSSPNGSKAGKSGGASQRIQSRFNSLDKDRDGLISRQEAPSRIDFDAADTNEDGFLSLDEVVAYTSSRRGR